MQFIYTIDALELLHQHFSMISFIPADKSLRPPAKTIVTYNR